MYWGNITSLFFLIFHISAKRLSYMKAGTANLGLQASISGEERKICLVQLLRLCLVVNKLVNVLFSAPEAANIAQLASV